MVEHMNSCKRGHKYVGRGGHTDEGHLHQVGQLRKNPPKEELLWLFYSNSGTEDKWKGTQMHKLT